MIKMDRLDFHTHREALPGETVVCNRMFPFVFPETEEGQGGGVTYSSVGLHPWYVPDDWEAAMASVASAARRPRVVALGECGLDRVCGVPMELQMTVFEAHVRLSERLAMPVVVHCVRALDLLLEVRRRMRPVQPWVWHGFRGGVRQMEQVLRSGMQVSFGIRYAPQALAACPADAFFLETDDADAPLLAQVYRQAAAVRGVSPEELLRVQVANFRRFCKANEP